MSADAHACETLRLAEPADRERAADALAAGAIGVCAFNGIYTLVGDADDPAVPAAVAEAKGRPQAKGVALVCPPEHLGEHVVVEAVDEVHGFARIQELQRAVHALGVILPAAEPGAPPHVPQGGTVLNVWTEEPPTSPLRELVRALRRRGRRALVGTSANRTGEPTIADSEHVVRAFADRVPLVLLGPVDAVPRARRRSASIVDFTGRAPVLVREGSVGADELRVELRRLGLGELAVAADVRRV